VVDELPGAVILVAHSMAGAYVLETSLQISKIKMIVLVDTLKNLNQVYTSEQADKMIFDLYRKNFKDTMLNVMPPFLFSQKTSKNIQDNVIGELINLGAEKAIKLLAPLYKMDPKELAEKITVPVRAINSDYSPANLENNVKYFKDYKTVTISDCGHYPMLEKPIEFNELLENILNSNKGYFGGN
jgi:pimeloyl-ACP methyl ester carboxylesterase